MTEYFPEPERPVEPEREPENQPQEAGENISSEPTLEWQPEAAEPAPDAVPSQEEPAGSPAADEDQTLAAEAPAYEPGPEAAEGMNPVESEPPAGPAGEPAPAAPARAPRPPAQGLSPEDERTWSMIAHLSMLLNLVTGFLGPVAALAVYLMYKDRSKTVAFHAMQSFIFQIITWIGGGLLIGAIWVITGLLSAVIIGLLCIPFAVLFTIILAALPVVGVVYSIVGAIQVNSGQPFSYWLVGDWVRGMLD